MYKNLLLVYSSNKEFFSTNNRFYQHNHFLCWMYAFGEEAELLQWSLLAGESYISESYQLDLLLLLLSSCRVLLSNHELRTAAASSNILSLVWFIPDERRRNELCMVLHLLSDLAMSKGWLRRRVGTTMEQQKIENMNFFVMFFVVNRSIIVRLW